MNISLWISISDVSQITDEMTGYNLIVPSFLLDDVSFDNIYVNLPMVVNNKDEAVIFDNLLKYNDLSKVKGVVVNNPSSLEIVKESMFSKEIILGPGMYILNNSAFNVFDNYNITDFIYPYELSKHEIKEISRCGILNIFGRTPLMVTQNCIRNTYKQCKNPDKSVEFGYITDRMDKKMPVLFQCENCYNIIYNAVTVSLHKDMDFVYNITDKFCISFTDETKEEVGNIISFYKKLFNGEKEEFPLKEFTKAYFTHGVL